MFFILAGAVAVGAYMLSDSEDDYSSSSRRYNREVEKSQTQIDQELQNAKKKDKLDKLFKVKKAKQKIVNAINQELKDSRDRYHKLNKDIKSTKDRLETLFQNKKESSSRLDKIDIQNEINIIISSRKELFKLRDIIKSEVDKLKIKLDEANKNRKLIQKEINLVLEG